MEKYIIVRIPNPTFRSLGNAERRHDHMEDAAVKDAVTEDAVTEDVVATLFPSTGIYDVEHWDGNGERGDVLRRGVWLVVVDPYGKRWPVRFYSEQTQKWVHKFDKELKPIRRPFFLEGEEEDPPIQGFLSMFTFSSVLYVHSAAPVDAEEEGLTLEYTSFEF